jgi:hypothetical protein
MRVTVATKNRSVTVGATCYVRGEVYEVDDATGTELIASGRFKVATVPPPDPRVKQRARAEALIDRLASMPDEVLDRFERFLSYGEGEAVAAAKAKKDGVELVTNDAPRTHGASVPDDEGADDLADMTVAQLRALARDRGIDLGQARKKDDIIAAIAAG